MKQITLKVKNNQYSMLLKFLQSLTYVEIVGKDTIPSANQKPIYDFSDLIGKLEWKGDALNEQRFLRDEW